MPIVRASRPRFGMRKRDLGRNLPRQAHACSAYQVVPLAWSALVALAVPLPLIYLTHWPVSIIYFPQLAAFGLYFTGLSHPSIRYRIVPARMKRDRAHAEALRQLPRTDCTRRSSAPAC